MRRHGSAQSQSSNISLLDEIAESFHTGVINQGTVSSLPLPVPENDAESALDEERYYKIILYKNVSSNYALQVLKFSTATKWFYFMYQAIVLLYQNIFKRLFANVNLMNIQK